MNITLKILRYNPETDPAPFFKEYALEIEPTDRVLDALLMVKEKFDATLAVRKSCGHGVCGSDAMRINGIERLACKSIIKDLAGPGATITIEPLRSMKVQRDLMVDQSGFLEKFRSIDPFLIPKAPPAAREYLQSPQERGRIDDATKCILCSACHCVP